MIWFWYFMLYSFLGFLLEVFYARITGGHPQRKCLLLLPVCPVYGLGACAIVRVLTPSSPAPVLFLWGMLLATAAEYGTAVFYELILQVSFWDYSHLPCNLHGRVCLLFSLIWGTLSIPLVRRLHPMVAALPTFLPRPLGFCLLLTFLCDCLISALLLRHHRHRDCLNWYHSLA